MRNIMILAFLFCISSSFGQSKYQLKETFDDNRNGWTEFVSKNEKVIIQDGALVIESKGKKSSQHSFTYLGVSLKDNFELSCLCIVKELTEKNAVGLIFNGENEHNLCAFFVSDGKASLFEKKAGKWTLVSSDKVKVSSKKNQTIKLGIKNSFGLLSFYVNDMEAISNITGRLDFSGFGFVALGDLTAKFDDFIIIQ